MEELVKRLSEAFDFPFFGCTGIGILSTEGYSQSSISLLVLTADDVSFSIVQSVILPLFISGQAALSHVSYHTISHDTTSPHTVQISEISALCRASEPCGGLS